MLPQNSSDNEGFDFRKVARPRGRFQNFRNLSDCGSGTFLPTIESDAQVECPPIGLKLKLLDMEGLVAINRVAA